MSAMPAVLSLVVLSFRQFETTTGPCLATLASALSDPKIELILVDNASDDGSAAHCAQWAARHPGALYLPQSRNLGFAGGMNVGVAAAHGEWVCLVNNDTLFPPGALDALHAAVARAPRQLAMLGPVTQHAGNGQCLPLPLPHTQHIVELGAQAMRAPTGLLTPTLRTDFFCVAVRRAVWQQLGGLDTAFGLGYFEDFDFSLRLRAAGFEQAIAEDVFVAHQGSATFAQMGAAQKQLMQRNRALLRQRHPGVHFESVRQGNAHALEHLLNQAQTHGWNEALRQRAAWRWAALLQDEPKSPFKRWRWRWTTCPLRRALLAAGITPQFPTLKNNP
jgi:GT2 family glycosyltransferase